MANTNCNKVVLGAETLIDLTGDTVASADDIAVGKIGHTKNGSVVTGTFTNDATATASDIQSGKTAYVNGEKITGTGSGGVKEGVVHLGTVTAIYTGVTATQSGTVLHIGG